jgi:uncharacterized protein YecT (DUF1311 family)
MKKIQFKLLGALSFFLFLAYPFLAFSQETVYPIDAEAKKCLEQKNTAFGMTECELNRFRQWSDEVDKLYDFLMNRLTKEEQELLRDQQINWVKFRDSHFVFLETFYGNRGSIWMSTIAEKKAELVKKRALDLMLFKDFLAKEEK